MKRGLHTLPQKPSSSHCIGITVDLPARQNSSRICRRRKWCLQCSGTDRVFSLSTSWPEVRQWMLSVTAKHCKNCDGPFRTRGAGCLVLVLCCCTTTLCHTWFDSQHISCRSSAGMYLITHLQPGPRVQWFPSFLTPQEIPVQSVSAFSEWQRGGDEGHTVVPIPGGRLLWHRDTKAGPMIWQMSQFQRLICWKIAQHLLYMF